jgi:hypothetical protein
MVMANKLDSDNLIEEYEPGVFVMEAEILYNDLPPLELDLEDLKNEKD